MCISVYSLRNILCLDCKFENLFISVFMIDTGECLPPRTISLAAATLNLLITLASLDLMSFQVSYFFMDFIN